MNRTTIGSISGSLSNKSTIPNVLSFQKYLGISSTCKRWIYTYAYSVNYKPTKCSASTVLKMVIRVKLIPG